MIIKTSIGNYRWHEDWAKIPESDTGKANGRTHAMTVTQSGDVIVFHQANPAVVTYDADGNFKSAWGDFQGAHGLTRIIEDGTEYLWLADQDSQQVVKTTLTGDIVLELPLPKHELYDSGEKKYIPTWAVQNPENGEIWVGDGYGAYLVHQYSASGDYLRSLDGNEGAGRFREPHGLEFTYGKEGLELWITDRSNHRMVVYKPDGTFLRSGTTTHSPCMYHFLDDYVLIPELFTGVKVLNKHTFEVLAEFGANPDVNPHADPNEWWPPRAPEGWPNLAGTDHIQEGLFNSPHGATFAPNGDIYVAEWIIGGRITKLERLD